MIEKVLPLPGLILLLSVGSGNYLTTKIKGDRELTGGQRKLLSTRVALLILVECTVLVKKKRRKRMFVIELLTRDVLSKRKTKAKAALILSKLSSLSLTKSQHIINTATNSRRLK